MLAEIITYNAETGAVLFDVVSITAPIYAGLIAGVAVGSGLLVVVLGVRWLLAVVNHDDYMDGLGPATDWEPEPVFDDAAAQWEAGAQTRKEYEDAGKGGGL